MLHVPAECVLVVDDGSTDETAQVVEELSVPVLCQSENRGKGDALTRAFRYVRRTGGEWVITLDGDGQHDPADLDQFFRCIDSGDYDAVIGNRHDRSRMPLLRRISNGATSVVLSLCSGNQRIEDSQCGFRAFRVDKIPFNFLKSRRFQFESEILLRMGKMGCRFAQVPISTRYGDESSSIRPISDTVRFIVLVIKSFFW